MILLTFMVLLFSGAEAAQRPNVIFVLIDDMGYSDMSVYGNKQIRTVHLDRLAKEGIRFTQFYVNGPVCSPSRAAFTTGQFPARWQLTSYLDFRAANDRRRMAQWLDPAAPSLARELQHAGYATGHFGKWHLGGYGDVCEAPLITDYGFDESLTNSGSLGDRIMPLLNAYDGQPPLKPLNVNEQCGRGKITWMGRSRVTKAFASRAIEFIQKAERDGKPFYVNVWPDDVHSPFFPPKALRGDGSKKQLYLGVAKAMDRQLAPLFNYVRSRRSLRSNTFIIVTSDNGPEPGAGSAGPFRGYKGELYEGGIREPFIVWAPGFIAKNKQGTVNRKTVLAGVDLLPSILRLAGLNTFDGLDLDGMDRSASFIGRAQRSRTKPLYWVRPPDLRGKIPKPELAMRDGDWKLLINRERSGAELYDLAVDARELRNAANEHPAIVRRMTEAVLQWANDLP